ncbi:MAG: 50S ribosomal protein L23 [Planctomycetaceae bacterium]|jgi:large subunit ribosomal protein L23|uniref:Large ribosomal subunit protein uL23 n=1 Tax=Lacipirellula limnantheis TaxID=2528024 RepID=A0A517U6G6_9BACT|nr:50S ribosomal protein L23 [Lacipirellula limnantheis]MBL9164023.1 50S ribosomal protein L23 [Planctomycetaceae bacterium]QDT76212.1 50S ribosomal protein L23 [Lacipirellula limnantheis]
MPRHVPASTSITLEPHQVIVKPLVTEKGMHKSTRNNAYAFEINRLATKEDVKRAVESLFEVKVIKVATQNRKGKVRRTRFRLGQTKDWKKAIVTLDGESRINFF